MVEKNISILHNFITQQNYIKSLCYFCSLIAEEVLDQLNKRYNLGIKREDFKME